MVATANPSWSAMPPTTLSGSMSGFLWGDGGGVIFSMRRVYCLIRYLPKYMSEATKNAMIAEALRALGLNEKEARLYRKIVPLGAQPASTVARVLGVPRSSAQFLAEMLVKKKVCTKSIRRGVIFYVPEPVEKLFYLLDSEREQAMGVWEERRKKLEEVAPLLRALGVSTVGRPRVSFLDGLEGIQAVYEDALTAKEPIRALAAFQERGDVLPEYFGQYYARRVRKGVHVRAIYPDTEFGRERQKSAPREMREAVLVPQGVYAWEPEVQVYDDKVTIASGKDRVGVIVQSQGIADAMKVLFDLAWEGAGGEVLKKKKGGRGK